MNMKYGNVTGFYAASIPTPEKALLQEIGRLTTRRSDAVLTRRSSHRSGGRTPARRHDGVNIDDPAPADPEDVRHPVHRTTRPHVHEVRRTARLKEHPSIHSAGTRRTRRRRPRRRRQALAQERRPPTAEPPAQPQAGPSADDVRRRALQSPHHAIRAAHEREAAAFTVDIMNLNGCRWKARHRLESRSGWPTPAPRTPTAERRRSNDETQSAKPGPVRSRRPQAPTAPCGTRRSQRSTRGPKALKTERNEEVARYFDRIGTLQDEHERLGATAELQRETDWVQRTQRGTRDRHRHREPRAERREALGVIGPDQDLKADRARSHAGDHEGDESRGTTSPTRASTKS